MPFMRFVVREISATAAASAEKSREAGVHLGESSGSRAAQAAQSSRPTVVNTSRVSGNHLVRDKRGEAARSLTPALWEYHARTLA
jgi:hypothetical protein